MIVDPPGTQLSHVSSPAKFVEVLDLMCNIQVPADFLKATEVRPSAPPASTTSLAVPSDHAAPAPLSLSHISANSSSCWICCREVLGCSLFCCSQKIQLKLVYSHLKKSLLHTCKLSSSATCRCLCVSGIHAPDSMSVWPLTGTTQFITTF